MGRLDVWDQVVAADHDVALLQEAGAPPADLDADVIPGPTERWESAGHEPRPWRTAVAAPRGGVTLRSYAVSAVHEAAPDVLGVSRPGTLTVADVVRDGRTLLTVASVYGTWESAPAVEGLIFSDASAHRLLSDLAQLVTSRDDRPLVVAGDWNMLPGYAEDGDAYWTARAKSVFDRAAAMGLKFVGPDGPTFRDDQQTPATATRQLDHVFASEPIADRVQVAPLNSAEEWGPSDHCRVSITVDV